MLFQRRKPQISQRFERHAALAASELSRFVPAGLLFIYLFI